MKDIPYAKVYAVAEAYAFISVLSGLNPLFYIPVALSVGTVGAVTVIKAVYINKRELKCTFGVRIAYREPDDDFYFTLHVGQSLLYQLMLIWLIRTPVFMISKIECRSRDF